MLDTITKTIRIQKKVLEKKLKKELGVFDVFAIATGAMISSGLFVLPAIALRNTGSGPAVIAAYFFASLMVIPALLSKAELATAMPKAGGTYFFIDRSLGHGAGTFGGFANWFSLALKSAFALIGMGMFATLIFPSLTEFQIRLIAVGCCIFFTLLNLVSIKLTSKFQTICVIILLLLLLIYPAFSMNHVSREHFIWPKEISFSAIFATAGLVFISFGGVTKVASIAEEVKNPNKNIPVGMILAYVITSLLYILVIAVTVGLLEKDDFINSNAPISAGAKETMGNTGMILLAIAGMTAFITTANAGILSASRFPMAMSRDGMLPDFFRKVSFRFSTPHFSIFLTGAFMALTIICLPLKELVKIASTLMLLLFLFENIAVIIMRESKIESYRPAFKSPLYPWLQILGILIYVALIICMGWPSLIATAAFIVGTLIWYWFYVRHRSDDKSSALVHVMERLVSKELAGTGHKLSSELREILRERDNIVEDRFDSLVRKCNILDIGSEEDRPYQAHTIFEMITPILSEDMQMLSSFLLKLFMEREAQSSTVIGPGLAIPHIIVDGENKFEILIVRCKNGIIFPESDEKVHTLFVLAGSNDQRNFHLRALAAIAQIAQDKDFDRNWLKARNTEELRNILLLAERKRIGVI